MGTSLITLSACGSASDASKNDPSPSLRPPQSVKVLASAENCDAQPMIVSAGTITFTATSTTDVPISVSLFAPEEGAFLKRIARIRVLKPNDTKTMTADLAQGAYEITCGTEELTSRKRITAI